MRPLPHPSPPPSPSRSAPVPGRTPAWQRRYRRHRRVLAALLAGAVVWGVVTAVRPSPAPTTAALVATRDLVPGSVVRVDDIGVEQRPVAGLPADAALEASAVVGRTVAFPVRAGEPVTARHVVGAELLAALGPGLVATPVALADAASGALVARGDLVDVLAATTGGDGAGASTAAVVASRVRVLVAPASPSLPSGALLAGAEPGGDGRRMAALVLATTTEQALAIARAAVGSRLSLTIRAS